MFFTKEDREFLITIRSQIKFLSNRIEMYEGLKNTKEDKNEQLNISSQLNDLLVNINVNMIPAIDDLRDEKRTRYEEDNNILEIIQSIQKNIAHLQNTIDSVPDMKILVINFRELIEKNKENLKRLNDMTIELKGVAVIARGALSERKSFDTFLNLAESKIMELMELIQKKNSAMIDNELIGIKKMISELCSAYNCVVKEPYAKVAAVLSTLERIEDLLKTKNTKKPKVKDKQNHAKQSPRLKNNLKSL